MVAIEAHPRNVDVMVGAVAGSRTVYVPGPLSPYFLEMYRK